MSALVLSAVERFLGATSGEERWNVAQALAQELGCSALNIASVSDADRTIQSARSSMSAQWLEEYVSEGFVSVDPLIMGMSVGRGMQCRSLSREQILAGAHAGAKSRALCAGLERYGYDQLLAQTYGDKDTAQTRLVVFAGDLREHDFHRAHTAHELAQVAGLIASFVDTAVYVDPALSGGAGQPALSTRERDVLALLAVGCRNDEIAYRLGIAEVTVRSHVTAARKKLGAKTREQALVEAIRTKQIAP